jgi:hypothetical protein
MARFLIMQWDWMGPIVLEIDGTEAGEAPSVRNERPPRPPLPARIAGAMAARFGAHERRHDD